jgi:two-component system LytT family response regulator
MPSPFTCIIVDDEPHARSLVQEYLEDYDHIAIVGTAGNGQEAIEQIHEARPDLVFLDVQMPELDGFDVLERLDLVPHIVFSTAYDEYALQAFEAGAVDYLLKPYNRDRFRTAVERATERIQSTAPSPTEPGDPPSDATGARPGPEATDGPADAAYVDRIATLLQEARDAESSGEAPKRLYVRHGEKIIPVEVASIRWAEAAGDYTKLHTDENTHLTSLGLGDLDARLPSAGFQRVHRSHLVALSSIDHLRSDGSGGYVLRLDDGTKLRVSRSYASKIREHIV